jgi:putative membrane protein
MSIAQSLSRRERGWHTEITRSPIRTTLLITGVIVLAIVWLSPLPALARHSFAAHMTMHMAVVAVAAPLLSIAMAGTTLDPTRVLPHVFAPLRASIVELVVVWVWHAPALHHAARGQLWVFVLEQASFLGAGLLLWIAAAGLPRRSSGEFPRAKAGAGVVALLFTSMHMTLLGALFALSNRPLFQHLAHLPEAAALSDQHLGGAIMLLVGGASYLLGGLWLTAQMLRARRVEAFS